MLCVNQLSIRLGKNAGKYFLGFSIKKWSLFPHLFNLDVRLWQSDAVTAQDPVLKKSQLLPSRSTSLPWVEAWTRLLRDQRSCTVRDPDSRRPSICERGPCGSSHPDAASSLLQPCEKGQVILIEIPPGFFPSPKCLVVLGHQLLGWFVLQ